MIKHLPSNTTKKKLLIDEYNSTINKQIAYLNLPIKKVTFSNPKKEKTYGNFRKRLFKNEGCKQMRRARFLSKIIDNDQKIDDNRKIEEKKKSVLKIKRFQTSTSFFERETAYQETQNQQKKPCFNSYSKNIYMLAIQMTSFLRDKLIIRQNDIKECFIIKENLMKLITCLLSFNQNPSLLKKPSQIIRQNNKIKEIMKQTFLTEHYSQQQFEEFFIAKENYTQKESSHKQQNQNFKNSINFPEKQQQLELRKSASDQTQFQSQKKQKEANLMHLQFKINVLNGQLNQLTQKILKKKNTLSLFQERISEMNSFFEKHSLPIQTFCKQYKNFKNQLSQYSLSFESKQQFNQVQQIIPFTQIVESIKQEQKNVNSLIQGHRTSQVCLMIDFLKNFIYRTMSKFRKRDEELNEIIAAKTKIITKIMEKIRRMQQYDAFKKQYLCNLQKDFASNYALIQNKLLKVKTIVSSQCRQKNLSQLLNILASISHIKQKLFENYTIGVSLS